MSTYRISQVTFEAPLPSRTSVRVRVRITSQPDEPASYQVFDQIALVDPTTGNNALFVNSSGVATPIDISVAAVIADVSYTAWLTPECQDKPGIKIDFVIPATGGGVTGNWELFASDTDEYTNVNSTTPPDVSLMTKIFSGTSPQADFNWLVPGATNPSALLQPYDSLVEKYWVWRYLPTLSDRREEVNGTNTHLVNTAYYNPFTLANLPYRWLMSSERQGIQLNSDLTLVI